MQSGVWAAENLLADARGRPRTPFHYRDKGIMAMIGRGAAIAAAGPYRRELRGLPAFGGMARRARGPAHRGAQSGRDVPRMGVRLLLAQPRARRSSIAARWPAIDWSDDTVQATEAAPRPPPSTVR